MSDRPWFQLSLKSLFLLTLLVATFLAGYSLATKQAEAERQHALDEARLKAEAALRLPTDWTGTVPSAVNGGGGNRSTWKTNF